MINYSSYFDELMDKAMSGEPVNDQENTGDPVRNNLQDPLELTKEIIKDQFYNFEEHGDFIGKFTGPGSLFKVGDKPVHTWQFKDSAGLTWLIPQWQEMDAAMGNFKGFSKEDPAQAWTYIITFKGKEKNDKGTKYNIQVFRKKF